jgi:hypothetical protein
MRRIQRRLTKDLTIRYDGKIFEDKVGILAKNGQKAGDIVEFTFSDERQEAAIDLWIRGNFAGRMWETRTCFERRMKKIGLM